MATVKYLRYYRDKIIKWSKEYYFAITVQEVNSSVELAQRLVGAMTFSNPRQTLLQRVMLKAGC